MKGHYTRSRVVNGVEIRLPRHKDAGGFTVQIKCDGAWQDYAEVHVDFNDPLPYAVPVYGRSYRTKQQAVASCLQTYAAQAGGGE